MKTLLNKVGAARASSSAGLIGCAAATNQTGTGTLFKPKFHISSLFAVLPVALVLTAAEGISRADGFYYQASFSFFSDVITPLDADGYNTNYFVNLYWAPTNFTDSFSVSASDAYATAASSGSGSVAFSSRREATVTTTGLASAHGVEGPISDLTFQVEVYGGFYLDRASILVVSGQASASASGTTNSTEVCGAYCYVQDHLGTNVQGLGGTVEAALDGGTVSKPGGSINFSNAVVLSAGRYSFVAGTGGGGGQDPTNPPSIQMQCSLTAHFKIVGIPPPAGDLFVTGGTNGVISEFSPGGVQSTFYTLDGDQLFGAAFDSAGNLFAADASGGRIFEITPDGTQSIFASGLSLPVGLAFDAAGNLFAADRGSSNIFKFAPTGAQSTFATLESAPDGLAFDSSGNLFISCGAAGTIFRFAPDGTQSVFVTGAGNPRGLAFDTQGNLYVADKGPNASALSGSIYKFTSAGAKSTFTNGLNQPIGLAFDKAGNLFVAESLSGAITKFTPSGSGSGFASGLDTPVWLAFKPDPLAITSVSLSANGGHVTLYGTGAPNRRYTIEASSDLAPASFSSIGSTLTDFNGAFSFEDINAASYARRFYRLSSP